MKIKKISFYLFLIISSLLVVYIIGPIISLIKN